MKNPARAELPLVLIVLLSTMSWAETWGDRAASVSARFLRVPYADDPLGESMGVDPDPRLRLDSMDCVTFVETVYAVAFAGITAAQSDTTEVLDRIRYARGIPSFRTRNHFTGAEWTANNSSWLTNVTDSIAGARSTLHTGRVSRSKLYAERGVRPLPGESDTIDITLPVIRPADVPLILDSLQDGDLLLVVKRRKVPDVAHLGFVVRDPSGVVMFRHASSAYGRVGQEPLLKWLGRNFGTIGISVLRATRPPPPLSGPVERVIAGAMLGT